jgi:DNA polymerase III epsilon subunit
MGIFSLFSQSLANETYVFFDVETTGLYPLAGDRIIEIAMIKTSKGNIVDTLNELVNPQIPIPQEAKNVNKIDEKALKNCPPFNIELADKILNFIDDAVLVAHNASFDLGFLSVEFGRLGIIFERWKAIDSLLIAKELFPGQKNSLESLIRRFNIMPEGELHRALIDTDALRKIFFELIEESQIRSSSVDQIIKKYGYKGDNMHHFIPAQIRESIIEKRKISGKYLSRDNNIIEINLEPISAVWVDKKWFLLANNKNSEEIISLYCERFIDITVD